MAKLADKMYLKRLLETPSVTGMESLVASLVRERLAECADVIETDVMGSVHARLLGNGSAPSVMIAAHMDEVGLMVKSIDSQGFLRVVPVGGVDAAILPGLRVDVHTSQGTCVAWWVASYSPYRIRRANQGDSHQRAFHRPRASAA